MKEKLAHIPLLPGVYLFKDKEGQVMYVGKAKSLRKRVSSYFKKQEDDWKIKSLIDEHATIDYIVTHSEVEALLLEAQLIRDNQPKYNVLLKNGQPFLYIMVPTFDDLPTLQLVRHKKKKGVYFGPFLHKRQARAGYEYLMKTFRLELCNKKIKEGCLRYHIGICPGSCRDDFDQEGYLFRLRLAMNVLRGNYKESLAELKKKIADAARELDFEKAGRLNYYLQNLDTIFTTLKTKFSEKKYEKEVDKVTNRFSSLSEPDFSLANQLQAFLGLPSAPHSIDCFDISHFQGKEIVGSCIRFLDGVPQKDFFRKFKIKTLTDQNDYAALQEIVARRYRNGDFPDLIVIDGGKGQLNAVKALFPEMTIISLAKREERVFYESKPDGILLDKHSSLGKMLMRLRDYAHHFAISYHRSKRQSLMKGEV